MTIQPTNISLTDRERDILIGAILGDATLQKRGNSYRIRIAHSINQAEYTRWMRKELDRLCGPDSEGGKIKTFTSKNGDSASEYFYLRSGLYLKPLFDLFFKEKSEQDQELPSDTIIPTDFDLSGQEIMENQKYRKSITKETIEKLPISNVILAVWYMDDGSARNDCFAGRIATQCFNYEEHSLLIQYLKNWKIEASATPHNKKKNQYTLSLPAATFGYFIQAIAPTVKQIPSMEYKLNKERIANSIYWKHLNI